MIRFASTRFPRPLCELPVSIEWKAVFAYDTSHLLYSLFREYVNFVHKAVGNHNGTDGAASTASSWIGYCYNNN